MRLHRLPALCAAAAAALALAACGSDTDTPTGAAENQGAPAEQPAGSKDGTTVTMRDIEFKPKDLKVKVGDTVKWVNEDGVDHDAVAKNDEFKSDLFGQGGSYTYKTEKAGKIEYVCSVHPGMEGTLTVEE
jgi:plastocyanin